jgi:sigma-B regulation protein RsbQ
MHCVADTTHYHQRVQLINPAEVLHRNNVNVSGVGTQPLLLAHGFGCDQNMWRFITPAFVRTHKIVLFDYVGSGKSDLKAYHPDRYKSLAGYADDVLEICTALRLSDVVFVGHSVSAMVGVLAAIRAPEIFSRIVMVGPSPRYINDEGYFGGFERKDIEELLATMDKNYIGWANFLAPVIMGNPHQPELSEELKASFCSTDPVIARRFAEVTFFADNRRDLPNLKIPSLVMQCTDDVIAPVQVGRYVHQHTPGSTFRQLAATGHCPHMSHPAETIRVMQEYLSAAA